MLSDEPYNWDQGGAARSGVPLWVLPLFLLGLVTLAGFVRSVTTQPNSRVEPVPRQTSLTSPENAIRSGG